MNIKQMQHFSEKWFQEIAESARLPPVSPEVIHALTPIVELQIRKIIQLAHKHQRHSKSKTLKVDDVNLALTTNKIEPIYGLHLLRDAELLQEEKAGSSTATNSYGVVNVSEYANNNPLPPAPLVPSISLHWLAVKGVQPAISENPTFIENESDHHHLLLPKELQYLYARITGTILRSDKLAALYRVLRNDTSMQELLPYLSRFFYLQIKNNSKRLTLLHTIIKSIHSLHQNKIVDFEAQLQQLLPAIFTCVVGSKLSLVFTENHWELRLYAAKLIADLAQKYNANFPDLHARICKTFIDAVSQKSSLSTIYGGVIGLGSLGVSVIKTVLLPQLPDIHQTLLAKTAEIESVKANSSYFSHDVSEGGKKRKFDSVEKQREYLRETELGLSMCREGLKTVLGQYITWNMQLPAIKWSNASTKRASTSATEFDVCGLEEALVPYYVVHSKDVSDRPISSATFYM
eukprot:gene3782-4040_t